MRRHITEPTYGSFSCNFYVLVDIKTVIPEEYGYHCHNGLELLYVHKGSGTMIIDCTSYRYREGSIILFQPYQIHGIFPDPGSDYVRSVLVLDPEYFMAHYNCFLKMSEFLGRISKELLAAQVISDDRRLLQGYIRFLAKTGLLAQGSKEENILAVLQMIHLLSQYETDFFSTSAKSVAPPNHYVSCVMQYIESHYRESYSIEKIAASLNISKYHLAHLFKRHTGITIGEYYFQFRLRMAKILLSSTDIPIAVISDRTGFSTPSYFSAKFKQLEGISPHEYRFGRAM